jgi:hypothetical protein
MMARSTSQVSGERACAISHIETFTALSSSAQSFGITLNHLSAALPIDWNIAKFSSDQEYRATARAVSADDQGLLDVGGL